MKSDEVVVRHLGIVDYSDTFARMRHHSANRAPNAPDEFWVLQHYPVYTQGYSCESMPTGVSGIPVIATDRGGQMTYHAPGQLVVYLLLDIKRRKQGIRNLVSSIENAVVSLLNAYQIAAMTMPKAPGVYVEGKKVASIGIRIKNGCTYHGISLNVNMDTTPFERIDVCGMQDLKVATLHELGVRDSIEAIAEKCVLCLADALGYNCCAYR